MKTKLLLFGFLFLSIFMLHAQCSPTITSPRLGVKFQDKMLFCNPTDSEILSTQSFGTYQWYRQEWTSQNPNPNPWVAISGATSQTLTIDGTADFMYYFKVAVSLNDCTAESPAILADGFAYGLPAMSINLTPGTYEQIDDSEYNICAGTPVKFENIYPVLYDVHTWYKCLPSSTPPVPGDPCILTGVTGPSYTATKSGTYGFYACTEYCPNQCEYLGDQYFVKLNFGNWAFCNTLGTGEIKPKQNSIKVYPNPTSQLLFIGKDEDKIYAEVSIIDVSGKLVMKKTNHQYKQPIDVSNLIPGNYIIISKNSEGVVYRNKFIKK